MGHRIEVIDDELRFPTKVYLIDGDLSAKQLEIARHALTDPFSELSSIDGAVRTLEEGEYAIEVALKQGVTDPEGVEARNGIQSALEEAHLSSDIGQVCSARQHIRVGQLTEDEIQIAIGATGNAVADRFSVLDAQSYNANNGFEFNIPHVVLPPVDAFTYNLTETATNDILILDQYTADSDLQLISDQRELSLNLAEMQTLRGLFADAQFVADRRRIAGLKPIITDAEVESFGQRWSEHCKHKKLGAKWIYQSNDPNDESGLPEVVDNIFASLIVATTRKIAEQVDWIVSAFEDNAGGITLNPKYNIIHKVESHNHPSFIMGFGGANTGTGGIIRDGKCLGKNAQIRSSQYAFRNAHPDSYKDLPFNITHPGRNFREIVRGVEDYGNKMGIPTMCGNVKMDDNYLKPTVLVGCVATQLKEINNRPSHVKHLRPGYIAISLGGPVGLDGVHGGSGSSDETKGEDWEKESLAQEVQIGNPICEKGVFEVQNILADLDYIEASQDCGAAGWDSAIGELAGLLHDTQVARKNIQDAYQTHDINATSPLDDQWNIANTVQDLTVAASPFAHLLAYEIQTGEIHVPSNGLGGCDLDLTYAPVKGDDIPGWIKLIAESQERNIIVVKPENLEKVLEICEHGNVSATPLAVFNDSGYYHVKDQNTSIGFVPVEFMHSALPQWEIYAEWNPPDWNEPEIVEQEDFTDSLLKLIERPNLQMWDWIITRYDHEVQGGSLRKPIEGPGRGRASAIAYRPILGEKEVAFESQGSNPYQGKIDGYHMGRNNVASAIAKIIASGGTLDKIPNNGNTMCPKPEDDPAIAATVLRMLKGAADAELTFLSPRISGKDSTSMQTDYVSTVTDEKVQVKSMCEYIVSALGVATNPVITSSDFKLPGDAIYIVGDTRDELGGSEFYLMHDELGVNVPKSNLPELKARYRALENAIGEKIVHSAQDLETGGLAMALANCAIGGNLGASVTLSGIDEHLQRADYLLASESTGRFLVTVHSSQTDRFEELMKDQYVQRIGTVREDKEVCISYKGQPVVRTDVDTLREANLGKIR